MKILTIIENKIRDAFYYVISLFLKNKKINFISNSTDIKRVLILRYDVLGDMICTYPAINYLKSQIPNVKIDVLGSESNSFLIKDEELIDNIYDFDGKILSNIKYLLRLRKNNYDLIYATYYINLTKNGILANLLGKPNTIKANIYDKEKRYLFFNFLSKVAKGKRNMFEKMYYLVADSLGKADEINELELLIPRDKKAKTKVDEYIEENELEKYIIINLSSGKVNRKWSTKKIIGLISLINEGIKIPIIITAMSEDQNDANRIVENSANTKFYGTGTIFEMIELIENAELVITPDTSIVHICSIVNTKVCVFIYQEIVNEGIWLPYKNHHRLLVPSQNQSVKEIGINEVYRNVKELLIEKN